MSLIDRTRNALTSVRTGVQHAAEKTANTVSGAANAVGHAAQAVVNKGQQVVKAVDAFENKAANKASALNTQLFGGSKPDKQFDGALVGAGGQTFKPGTPLSQVPGVTPKNNPNPSETVIYVNGITNTKDDQLNTMQHVADTTGAKVIGIHNATEGMITDIAQCVQDKLDKGKNPAVDSMADAVYSESRRATTCT